MTIHPFPKSLRGSLGRRGWLSSGALFSPPSDLTGVRQRTSASKLAAPAFFFHTAANANQHLGQGRMPMRDVRSERSKRRDFLFRAEQIVTDAILQEAASADLLSRAYQVLNSLCVDAPNNGDITWNSLSSKSPASFGPEMTEKFFQ